MIGRPFAGQLAALAAAACTVAAAASGHATAPDRFDDVSVIGPTCGVPHLGIFGDVTTVLANTGYTLYYKTPGRAWTRAPFALDHAHSLVRLASGGWLIGDTDHHRLIQTDDLSGTGAIVTRSELSGIKLRRPHDELVDPKTGDVYVIAGDRHLFRFKDLQGPIDVWTFTPEELGYVRALSWFDDRLHVVNSSRGEVLRIDDFAARRFTKFRSPRPPTLKGKPSSQIAPAESRDDFDAGSLSTTGLILNDVEKHAGWYYGSNDFLVEYALGGDTGPARLIRWRSWEDFERGQWEDLSAHIPAGDTPLVPYFITIHDGILYVPVQRVPDERCEHGRILRLDLDTLPTK